MSKIEGGLVAQGRPKERDPAKIVVSIITVVYNGEKHLSDCIDSVVQQDYGIENIEYIIVDGSSQDRTLDIIREYDNKGYIDYWVSEKDNGVYDAMNKGIKVSTGDIISFMNSDDYYYLDAVRASVNAITKSNSDYSFGNALCIDRDSGFSAVWKGDLNYIFFDSAFVHQTQFLRRKCFQEVGLFEDKKTKVWSDWEFNSRLYKNRYRHVYVDKTLACYMLGGLSGTSDRTFERGVIRDNFYLKGIGLTNTDIEYLTRLIRFNVFGETDKELGKVLQRIVNHGPNEISLYFLKSLCLLLRKDNRRLEREKYMLENDDWYKFGRLTKISKLEFLFYKAVNRFFGKKVFNQIGRRL